MNKQGNCVVICFVAAMFAVSAFDCTELNAQQNQFPAAQPPAVTAPASLQTEPTGFELPVNTGAASGENSGAVAFGAASGNAPRVATSRRLIEVLKNGGPLMIPIGICSFILVVFIFERMISLRRGRIIPKDFTNRFLDQLKEGELNQDAASSLCKRNDSPMARVFLAGIAKWGRPAVEVEQAVIDAGERNSNQMRRYLRLINGVATVCPLLGLLGTVLGMIHAFDAIATVDSSVTDPKSVIATGISQALLTTAAGMTVAIPALIAYLFFSSRADRHVMEIDELGQKVVNHVSAEALIDAAPKTTRRSTRKAA